MTVRCEYNHLVTIFRVTIHIDLVANASFVFVRGVENFSSTELGTLMVHRRMKNPHASYMAVAICWLYPPRMADANRIVGVRDIHTQRHWFVSTS